MRTASDRQPKHRRSKENSYPSPNFSAAGEFMRNTSLGGSRFQSRIDCCCGMIDEQAVTHKSLRCNPHPLFCPTKSPPCATPLLPTKCSFNHAVSNPTFYSKPKDTILSTNNRSDHTLFSNNTTEKKNRVNLHGYPVQHFSSLQPPTVRCSIFDRPRLEKVCRRRLLLRRESCMQSGQRWVRYPHRYSKPILVFVLLVVEVLPVRQARVVRR